MKPSSRRTPRLAVAASTSVSNVGDSRSSALITSTASSCAIATLQNARSIAPLSTPVAADAARARLSSIENTCLPSSICKLRTLSSAPNVSIRRASRLSSAAVCARPSLRETSRRASACAASSIVEALASILGGSGRQEWCHHVSE
eukprot:2290536-Pleurochrysis_carterae.AAC.2